MAIKIGLTGGIGSGKSVVAHLLKIMGIPVYVADIESKRLTAENKDIKRELIEILGENLYRNDSLNKPLLASYIFSDQEHAKRINQIIHPRVRADFKHWLLKHREFEFVALESAILIEAGFDKEVDMVLMVYASEDLRLKRAISRDSSSVELVRKRMQSQMNDDEKIGYADYIIYNDGDSSIMFQLETFFTKLRKGIHS